MSKNHSMKKTVDRSLHCTNENDTYPETKRRRHLPKQYEGYVLDFPTMTKWRNSGRLKKVETFSKNIPVKSVKETKGQLSGVVYKKHLEEMVEKSSHTSHAACSSVISHSSDCPSMDSFSLVNCAVAGTDEHNDKLNLDNRGGNQIHETQESCAENSRERNRLQGDKKGMVNTKKSDITVDDNNTKAISNTVMNTRAEIERDMFQLQHRTDLPSTASSKELAPIQEPGDMERHDSERNGGELLIYNMTKAYKCQFCTWSFNKKCLLFRHLKHYHGPESPRLKRSQPVRIGKSLCEICGKVIQRYSQLQIHLRSHTGEKAFFCNTCHRGFNVACNYRRHLLRHGKRKFQCSHCQKQYFEKRHLNMHFLKMHSNVINQKKTQTSSLLITDTSNNEVFKFSCQYCNKRYSAEEGLTRHLQHNHIPCKECGKISRNHSEHRTHLLVHTSYKPFLCKVCDKSFKCKMSLRHHMICHTDSMPYRCNLCEKKFKQPQGLWRHKKYHQAEKPHVCSVCSKAFCHKPDLKRHYKIHEHKKSCHEGVLHNLQLLNVLSSEPGHFEAQVSLTCKAELSERSELKKQIQTDSDRSIEQSTARTRENITMTTVHSAIPGISQRDRGLLLEQHRNRHALVINVKDEPLADTDLGDDSMMCFGRSTKYSETGLHAVNQMEAMSESCLLQTLLPDVTTPLDDHVLLSDGITPLAVARSVTDIMHDNFLTEENITGSIPVQDKGQPELMAQHNTDPDHVTYVIIQTESGKPVTDYVCADSRKMHNGSNDHDIVVSDTLQDNKSTNSQLKQVITNISNNSTGDLYESITEQLSCCGASPVAKIQATE